MTVLLVLLLFILVLLIIRLCIVQEGFEQPNTIDPDLLKSYNRFIEFYNPFLVNWEKSIITSISINSPAPAALTSPSQIGNSISKPVTPSRSEINAYITKLSKTLDKPLPPMTDPLPSTLDISSVSTIKDLIPKDAKAPINALEWMNKNIASSHAGLNSTLQVDHFYNIEGFDNDTCAAVTQCIKEQQEYTNAKSLEEQKALQIALDKFNSNTKLTQLMDENHALVEKSNSIKNQAESGDLFNKISVSSEPTVTYSNPAGANNLKEMKSSDPAKYKSYEKNYGHLFTLKQQLDDINANLR
jgi:hypothetical protein